MCGIAGYIGIDPAIGEAVLGRMARQLIHRGPDGQGMAIAGQIGMVHRWLDLKPRLPAASLAADRGPQPIRSADGRWLLVMDGVVHNVSRLQDELGNNDHSFADAGEPEVVLAAWRRWGTRALERINGAFAVAIVDTATGEVVLARDQLGAAPLYVAADGSGRVAFASEIRAVLAAAVVPRRPEQATIARYLRLETVDDTERTFFSRITRVMPGQLIRITQEGAVVRHTYSRLREDLARLAAHPRPYDQKMRKRIATELTAAVRRRVTGDVPLGVLVSGSVESVVVQTLVDRLLGRPSPDREAQFGGRAVHQVAPEPDRLPGDLTDFVRAQQEPVLSPEAFLHYQVVRQAARHVRVLLDEQGPGQLVGGDPSYHLHRVRYLLRRRRFGCAAGEMRYGLRLRALGRQWLAERGRPAAADGLLSLDFARAYAGERRNRRRGDVKRRLLDDICQDRLPALLRWRDHNTMWFSVQARAPMLDPRLLRLLWSLDESALLGGGKPVPALRDATTGLLPRGWFSRLGRGEARPTATLDAVLRRSNNFLAEVLFSETFRARPYFNPTAVTNAVESFLAGRPVGPGHLLWRVLNLELWLREFIDTDPTVRLEVAARFGWMEPTRGGLGSPPQHLPSHEIEHVVDLGDAQEHRQTQVAAAHHSSTDDQLEPGLTRGERA